MRIKTNAFFFVLIITTQTIQTATHIILEMIQHQKKTIKLQNYSLSQLKNIHDKEQHYTFPLIQSICPLIQRCQDESLLATFLLAQKKMNLSKITPLFKVSSFSNYYNQNNSAQYFTILNTVVYSSIIFDISSPTAICQTLLHELRHSQQFASKIDLAKHRKEIESDADRFAIDTMQCFVCRYLIQHDSFHTSNNDGYFCKSDCEPYLQASLKNNERCKAHQQISQKNLSNFNATIDRNCGQLQDRLPKKINPLPLLQK